MLATKALFRPNCFLKLVSTAGPTKPWQPKYGYTTIANIFRIYNCK